MLAFVVGHCDKVYKGKLKWSLALFIVINRPACALAVISFTFCTRVTEIDIGFNVVVFEFLIVIADGDVAVEFTKGSDAAIYPFHMDFGMGCVFSGFF